MLLQYGCKVMKLLGNNTDDPKDLFVLTRQLSLFLGHEGILHACKIIFSGMFQQPTLEHVVIHGHRKKQGQTQHTFISCIYNTIRNICNICDMVFLY